MHLYTLKKVTSPGPKNLGGRGASSRDRKPCTCTNIEPTMPTFGMHWILQFSVITTILEPPHDLSSVSSDLDISKLIMRITGRDCYCIYVHKWLLHEA